MANRRASTQNAAGGGGSNPLQNDDELQTMMNDLDAVSDADHFIQWRTSFVDRLDEFLGDAAGRDQARAANATVVQKMPNLDKVILNLQSLVGEDGTLNVGVKLQMGLNKLKEGCLGMEKTLEKLVPSNSFEMQACGYSKFHLGAVLVNDGFRLYAFIMIQEAVLKEALLPPLEAANVDRQMLDAIHNYFKRIRAMRDVLADLGLFKVMQKTREFLPDLVGSTLKMPAASSSTGSNTDWNYSNDMDASTRSPSSNTTTGGPSGGARGGDADAAGGDSGGPPPKGGGNGSPMANASPSGAPAAKAVGKPRKKKSILPSQGSRSGGPQGPPTARYAVAPPKNPTPLIPVDIQRPIQPPESKSNNAKKPNNSNNKKNPNKKNPNNKNKNNNNEDQSDDEANDNGGDGEPEEDDGTFLVFFDPITKTMGKISRCKCISKKIINLTPEEKLKEAEDADPLVEMILQGVGRK